MKHDLTEQLRDAGYEALFHLGGFLALAVHPTPRNQDRIFQWIDETQERRQHLNRLAKRGLIEAGPDGEKGKWVARLTDLGHAAFAGGRHPERAWNREWDGRWRLLSFDLPRHSHDLRMKLRRWLDANFFGRLQGSVWISPDPVPSIGEILAGDGIDPGGFAVFEGVLVGALEPREVAERAWDFAAINAGYTRYTEAAVRAGESLREKPPSTAQVKKLLSEDRKSWWEAVRRDPLLPKVLLPREYKGGEAWKTRSRLLGKLATVATSAAGGGRGSGS